MVEPREVATRHTLSFCLSQLAPRARVLEVGCGLGHLAAALEREGFDVVALDVSEEAVAPARAFGVDAHVCDFFAYEAERPFQAVLFTRSLHHLFPLDGVLSRARALLAPRGKCLVEEFARDEVDSPTATWFYGLEAFLTGKPLPADPLAHWTNEHTFEPPLHSGTAMEQALRAHFPRVEAERVPYLYRSFLKPAEQSPWRERVSLLLDWERALIHSGSLRPVGLRAVADLSD